MTRETRRVIHSWADVPQFASEADEAAWWPTVDFGEDFAAASEPVTDDRLPPKRPRAQEPVPRPRR
ncbi:MAG TPA: hypothetical protein VFA70_09865 [Dehalococcoidia bacterium]|jgi:hypothetical protein|nr:hypothetical protein [Chloroflexota bacterium]HZU77059.1 hypothetical protein [Dehalococcoidia bacterium]